MLYIALFSTRRRANRFHMPGPRDGPQKIERMFDERARLSGRDHGGRNRGENRPQPRPRDALRMVDQPVPRLPASLRLLLRPAHAHIPRGGRRRALGRQDLRQDERRRGLAPGAVPHAGARSPRLRGDRDRPVPAARRDLPHHARHLRRTCTRTDAGASDHALAAGRSRCRRSQRALAQRIVHRRHQPADARRRTFAPDRTDGRAAR